MKKLFSRQLWLAAAIGCLILAVVAALYTTMIYYQLLPLCKQGWLLCLLVAAMAAGGMAAKECGLKIYRAALAALLPFLLLVAVSCLAEDKQGSDSKFILLSGGMCLAGGIISALLTSGNRAKSSKRRKHNYVR